MPKLSRLATLLGAEEKIAGKTIGKEVAESYNPQSTLNASLKNASHDAVGPRSSVHARPQVVGPTSSLASGPVDAVSGLGSRVGATARWGWANMQGAADAQGKTVLRMMGNHAVRGALMGAAAGGTMETMQGGSFWDGAVDGAFKGAVGWSAYKAGGYMAGRRNIVAGVRDMYRATGMGSAGLVAQEMSKPASVLLNHKQMANFTRNIINR